MMTVGKLLAEFRSQGIELWADGQELRYRAPKSALPPERLQAIRARKAEILEFLRAGPAPWEPGLPAARPPIVAGLRPPMIPLSFEQEGLWFLEQLGLAKEAYYLPTMLRLKGALDVAALERSLTEIIRRHESLRTRFESVQGRGVQIVMPAPELRFERIDLSCCVVEERDQRAGELIRSEPRRAFDLSAGPPLRTMLLRLSEVEHVLLLTIHHIVADAWSMGILVKELSALYVAYTREERSPLAPLPLQYADYALWQRSGGLQDSELRRQLEYWRQRLDGAPAVLVLPTDRPRPLVASLKGDCWSFEVPLALFARLAELGRKQGATLFMVLMAAYQTLLCRWSGQPDVLVGTPIACRQQRELEGLIGFFINTLVIRTDLAADPTFCELLEQVKQTALEAYAHQELPFEKVVEALQPARQLGRQPLAQVQFMLQNTPPAALELPGVCVEAVELERTTAKYDLNLAIRQTAVNFTLAFEFPTDLFETATIARLAESFVVLLEGIAADPQRRISALPLMTASEQRRLLEEWSGAGAMGQGK